MVKLLKWAYDLGVKHERERIASALGNELSKIHNRQFDVYSNLEKRSSKPTPESERIELSLLEGANRLIDSILSGEIEYVQGESIMFPKEDK